MVTGLVCDMEPPVFLHAVSVDTSSKLNEGVIMSQITSTHICYGPMGYKLTGKHKAGEIHDHSAT